MKKGVIIRGKVGRRMKMGRRVIIREEVGWRRVRIRGKVGEEGRRRGEERGGLRIGEVG